ncbi:glutamate-rich protein 6 [Aplochiton taeniatus]
MCEYCGEKALPPLHMAWVEGSKYQQLCEMLQLEKQLALEKSDQQQSDASAAREHKAQTMEIGKTLSYQLSTCPPTETWTVTPKMDHRMELNVGDVGEDSGEVPFHDHKLFLFGICHHQDVTRCQQRYYSCGIKFLTLFPDGSAQLFYPSGLLALVIIVVKGKGRVCVVYDDDSHAPEQSTRALFQSDGKVTCYHENGNVWLSMVQSGGQCLDESGSRVRRWSWGSHGNTPTPLRPFFISLNQSIGVRVLGQGQVFVSFLASGQQAKFSVGCCVQSVGYRGSRFVEGPSISKEELFQLAGRIKAHLTLRQLHLCLETPPNPRPVREKLPLRLFSVAQRLLDLSHSLDMRVHETAFIQQCLHDCLSCRWP